VVKAVFLFFLIGTTIGFLLSWVGLTKHIIIGKNEIFVIVVSSFFLGAVFSVLGLLIFFP